MLKAVGLSIFVVGDEQGYVTRGVGFTDAPERLVPLR